MSIKFVVEDGVFVEITNGIVVISQRYDGPLGQDRFHEIGLSPVGSQALLDFLANGQAVEHSVQADGDYCNCYNDFTFPVHSIEGVCVRCHRPRR